MKRGIYLAEQKKGAPVYKPEIYREWVKITWAPSSIAILLHVGLLNLFLNDEIMSDDKMNMYSVNPAMQHIDGVNETGFRLMSDHMYLKYPDYTFDEYTRAQPKEET